MKTKKQAELVGSFLGSLGDEIRPVYQNLIAYLDELGYNPQKGKSRISFKHDTHNKQIAKVKMVQDAPCFSLRFSACREYSGRFADIIAA